MYINKLLIAVLFTSLSIGTYAADYGGGDHKGDTEKAVSLHENMEEMQDAYRDLGRGLRRATADDVPELLDHVQKLQILAIEAKVMIPDTAKNFEGNEQAAFIAEYRKQMIDTVETLIAMEKALLAFNIEEADKQFDVLKEQKSKGHEQFQPSE